MYTFVSHTVMSMYTVVSHTVTSMYTVVSHTVTSKYTVVSHTVMSTYTVVSHITGDIYTSTRTYKKHVACVTCLWYTYREPVFTSLFEINFELQLLWLYQRSYIGYKTIYPCNPLCTFLI